MTKISQRAWYVLTICVVLAVSALFLGGVSRCDGFGFPLDDGWIHQTYARNLAQSGRFAYGSEQVSVGSTSPMWTLLLSVGYLMRVPPLLWSYVLGMASWLLIAWTSESLVWRLFPRQRSVARWVGLACLVEWHLAWASLSGMEITLFTFLSLLLIERHAAGAPPFWLGVAGGFLCLVRPEGIVLVGLLVVVILADHHSELRDQHRRTYSSLASTLVDVAAGVAALLVPYVVFNQIVSGQPFPNTFYAKQAEYQSLLAQPIWVRLWRVLRRPLVGAQALLVPGFVWQVIRVLRRRANRSSKGKASPSLTLVLLPVIWCTLLFAAYAFRMPVDYQYGRYLMPAIPYLLIYGLLGTACWLAPRSPRLMVRVWSRAVPLAIGCLFVAFLIIGGRAYAEDVCLINGEMVEVAAWLEANTPRDALIAAHDIGAVGYLAQRSLIDLAGLVTPDVVPFIRDETRLLEFVMQEEADYLVTFPSWYPKMVADDRLELVYQTQCAITRQRGGDNMAVYRIRR